MVAPALLLRPLLASHVLDLSETRPLAPVQRAPDAVACSAGMPCLTGYWIVTSLCKQLLEPARGSWEDLKCMRLQPRFALLFQAAAAPRLPTFREFASQPRQYSLANHEFANSNSCAVEKGSSPAPPEWSRRCCGPYDPCWVQ